MAVALSHMLSIRLGGLECGVSKRAAIPVLEVDAGDGLLRGARQVPSPNCDARPDGAGLSLIVVHGISLPPGEFGGPWIDHLFQNRLPADAHPYFAQVAGLKVSSHLLIRRDGEAVQYVSFNQRAWHAGRSSFEGREACNDFSVGIELEGTDDLPYADPQYVKLAAVVRALCRAYSGLDPHRVVGHSEVSPGRKSDPGQAFDWSRIRSMIGAPSP
jgi:N-acetyl-anhydromuramoyl-L-alanine amidase